MLNDTIKEITWRLREQLKIENDRTQLSRSRLTAQPDQDLLLLRHSIK